MDALFLLIFLMLCMGFAGWMFFLWAVKSGQYDDIEGPKYRMLDDDEEDNIERSKETGKTFQSHGEMNEEDKDKH
jgi:cbb3-type cytochrome oxidase maturation protein